MADLAQRFSRIAISLLVYCKGTNLEHFDLLLSKLLERVRFSRGQNAMASLAIMDSQSLRWENNCSLNSLVEIKKSKRIKRHLRLINGFLLAIMVTVANVHDSKAVDLLEAL